MINVIEVIIPIVLIASFGFFCRRRNILSSTEGEVLEKVTLWFLIPCLLFAGTATSTLPPAMDWHYLLGFYLTIALVYALGMLLGKILFAYSLPQLSAFGMAGAYSNVTVLGIPISLELLGEEAFVPMLIVITFHNLFIFTLGTILAESGSRQGGQLRGILKEIIRNPISGSLLAGALVNVSGIPLYQPLVSTLDLLGQAAVPGALFALGTALTRYHIKGDLKVSLVLVVLKLVIFPTLMWFMMFEVFAVPALWGKVAVILATMPVGISVYVFSRRYAVCEGPVATAIVISSLLSVISISVFATLLASQAPG